MNGIFSAPKKYSKLLLTTINLLLVAFLSQTILQIGEMSAASDETPHLVAGYTYLKLGDFRLNPQHPPFAKELSALPLQLLSPVLDLTWPGWNSAALDEWTFGGHFLFKNNADQLLFWARLPIVGLGLALCCLIFVWAQNWYGTRAALFALFLAVFCPLFLAHSCFVTTDIALTLFWSLTLYWLWRYLESRDRFYLVGTGVSLGLALGSKFSGVLLIPLLPLFLAFRANGANNLASLRSTITSMLIIFGVGFLIVQLLYGASLDPLIYYKGLRMVNADHRPNYPAYLFGDFQIGGFWYYFLAAFLVKTPLPLIILSTIGLIASRKTSLVGPMPTTRLAIAIVPLFAIFIAASLGASNFGVRYVLPAYPALIVLAAGATSRFFESLRGRILVILLFTWYGVSTLRSFPDYLAYFNELAGGTRNGHKVLDDSNIEWGQDLKRLSRYLEVHGIEEVKLLYPWSGLPRYYGIRTIPMKQSDWESAPSPGVYAISTHALIRGLWQAEVNGVKSDWIRRYTPVDRVGAGFWIFRFPS